MAGVHRAERDLFVASAHNVQITGACDAGDSETTKISFRQKNGVAENEFTLTVNRVCGC